MVNKENENCAEKKARLRGENWTQEEKDIFIEIMRHSASIVDNKQTDTNSNKRKYKEWLKIQKQFKELTGIPRDIPQLKGLWRRTKMAAKKAVFDHQRASLAGGGGLQPPSPTPNDLKVMELCPTDFVMVEETMLDSDEVLPFTSQEDEAEAEEVNNAIHSIEENEDVVKEPGVSFVTVGDVRTLTNEEINKSLPVTPDHCYVKSPPEDNKCIKTESEEMLEIVKGNNIIKKKKIMNKNYEAAIIKTYMEMKRRKMCNMEEEYALKLEYQKQELAHQKMRHKIELDLLLLEKKKKELEIELIKKQLLQ